MNVKDELLKKFTEYVSIQTQSDPANEATTPSNPNELEFAKHLAKDLEEIGLQDVYVDEKAFVIAKLPSNVDYKTKKVGFLSHMDTVPVGLSPQVNPQVVKDYKGDKIVLNKEKNLFMDTTTNPELKDYIGDDLVVTDGTSVLGADDKSGVTSITIAFKKIVEDNIPHGDIYLAFVPDEEIGCKGAQVLDLDKFNVDFAYTVDGEEIGDLAAETFNAATAFIHIEGVVTHPKNGKGKMVNPILIANDIINNLNPLETPENTEKKEGYLWACDIKGNQKDSDLEVNIRAFDINEFNAKKEYLEKLVELMRLRHPKATITINIEHSYSNIASAMPSDGAYIVDYMLQAMKDLDIKAKLAPIRGGTDGSILSARGIPTPNFFTGAHNIHSYKEFIPMKSFEKACLMVVEIVKLVAQKKI